MTSERKPPFHWWGAGVDFVAGIAVFILMQLLMRQWGYAYGTGDAPASPEEIRGYLAIVAATLVILVVGFGVALSQRRKAAIRAYPIVGIIVVATMMLFAVPTIDWHPDTVYPVNPGYCSETDSTRCPGG